MKSEGASPEHFLPIRKSALVELLGGDPRLTSDQHEQFSQFCEILAATLHHQYHLLLEELKDNYAPFDPDDDTRPVHAQTFEERQHDARELFADFDRLLLRANFFKLSHDDIESALETASEWGVNLSVDFELFDYLAVYARGDSTTRKQRRPWRNFYRAEEVDVPIFQRVVVIFRVKPGQKTASGAVAEYIYLKIFKNIPHMDLQMMLPGTKVKMTLFDQGKIWLPTLSGLAIAVYKVLQGALLLVFAGVYGILAFLGLVGGTIGYGVRSFYGYLRTKDKYHLNLTRSLYYQNLDNNAGVLFRLIDAAEEQEAREAILAYFLLWQEGGESGLSELEIDTRAELLLGAALQMEVDFEVDDALEKLARLGLAEQDETGKWRGIRIEEALARLDHTWDHIFPYASGQPAELPQPLLWIKPGKTGAS